MTWALPEITPQSIQAAKAARNALNENKTTRTNYHSTYKGTTGAKTE